MTNLQAINASASPEVQMNDNTETLSAAGIFGKRQPATSGLTWGFYGGVYNGNTVADGTVALTNGATNYVVVKRSDGVVSVSTATTNWNNATDYARLYQLTTAGSVVTATVDNRMDTGGLLLGGVGGGGGGTIGKHMIPISAKAMTPYLAAPCAPLATINVGGGANRPDFDSLDFANGEYATFALDMPESWDEGAVSFAPVWSHAATTTNFGVRFDLAAVAVGDDDTMAVAFGTANNSDDTGGTTDDIYKGPESGAITVAGSPQAGDRVFFLVGRPSGTLAIDARLHSIRLYYTTAAETD